MIIIMLLLPLLLLLLPLLTQAFLPPPSPRPLLLHPLAASLDDNAVNQGWIVEVDREKNRPSVLAVVVKREKNRLTLEGEEGRQWEVNAKDLKFSFRPRGVYSASDLR